MKGLLQFATPGADGKVRFVLDYGWSGTNTRKVPVTVHDMRAQARALDLDRDGFVLDRIDSPITDYADPDQLERLWKPAVVDTILRTTGGSLAALFAGPNVRFSEADPRAQGTSVSAPARSVHSDLAHTFAYAQMDLQPHADQGMRELRKRTGDAEPGRWRVFNIWQMISPPPQDSSLAVCRLSTLSPDDYLHGRGYFDRPELGREDIIASGDGDFDLSFFRENPAQQWCYFSEMQTGEALIFSAFDPQDNRGQGRVAHGAFDLADASGLQSRSSIEIRALVVYD